MIRIPLLIFTAIIAVFTTPLLALPIAFWYSLRYFAPELIVIAALLDAYFGAVAALPYYTLTAFLMIIVTMFIKRYIMI
ncbi:hypothetical protein A2837_02010 [Candidatus Kaiserbacteria bacterium RIFCSPHIGHO2_01_FULL_46_22]|uniref:Uncharacterized protein n=1 Tax=Candidatus Kaiserbacteria bacterium RIFCSPHIGHO2_01_FULL_46_22 TaxID=1798475 RepID=A0A1F6BYV4_9BACT|nr:MAG: hypothetical protein A2837_02010 [Candidatus Kaiserbacteria bacterium RIFCSPHIGHO2_01_FULL_46_22]